MSQQLHTARLSSSLTAALRPMHQAFENDIDLQQGCSLQHAFTIPLVHIDLFTDGKLKLCHSKAYMTRAA